MVRGWSMRVRGGVCDGEGVEYVRVRGGVC